MKNQHETVAVSTIRNAANDKTRGIMPLSRRRRSYKKFVIKSTFRRRLFINIFPKSRVRAESDARGAVVVN